MLVAMALAAMAFAGVSATVASAVPFQVWDNELDEPCGDLLVIDDEYVHVEGGCWVDGFTGGFDLVWQSGSAFYDVAFDLRVGPDGAGVAINQTVSTMWGPQRAPCTNSEGQKNVWPVEFAALGGGEFAAEIALKLKPALSPDGVCGGQETIPLAVTEFGGSEGTDLVQNGASAPVGFFADGEWSSDNLLDLVEIEEEE